MNIVFIRPCPIPPKDGPRSPDKIRKEKNPPKEVEVEQIPDWHHTLKDYLMENHILLQACSVSSATRMAIEQHVDLVVVDVSLEPTATYRLLEGLHDRTTIVALSKANEPSKLDAVAGINILYGVTPHTFLQFLEEI